ncbi:MAG: response regulator [Bryobacteraceae bacterium]
MQQVNIMVVEDEKIVAADIRHNLTNLGYSVPSVLATGEEAIKKAAEQCPDLVLMDIHLKGKIDGIEAAKIVQSRLNVPVVFITAFADEATIQRAKSTEPYGYIVKPFGKKELQSTIEIALYKYGRERRLKTNEQWLMSVFRSIGEGVIAVDRAGSVCIMNVVAEAITGCALDESLGAHWQDLWQFLDAKACGGTTDPISAAFEHAGTFHLIDCPVHFAKTGTRIVIGSIAPIKDSCGRVSGAVVAFRDITGHRSSENEYHRVRHLESLQRLAGDVAHTMNNVVTLISGYTESLLRSLDRSSPPFRDAQMIEKANNRALALTRQLLGFSRRQPAQAELIQVNQEILNLEQMLRHSVGPLVDIHLELAPQLSSIEADPSHLEQIVMALGLNARENMAGKGTLTIRTASVRLKNALISKFVEVPPGDYVLIQVADTGAGVPYENQWQIFEPFFAAGSLPKGAASGRSAAYALVKQAGGHIWFESSPETGTMFSVYIPVASASLAISGRQQFAQLRGGTETILVVDDDAASRHLALEPLQHLGYSVLQAASAQEALKICQKHDGTIDLVMADVMLPNMTGLDLAYRLSEVRNGLKVLFTSTYSRHALQHHGAIEEGTLLLQKPFTPEVLAVRLREMLEPAP